MSKTKGLAYEDFFEKFIREIKITLPLETPPEEYRRRLKAAKKPIIKVVTLLYYRKDIVEQFFYLPVFDDNDAKDMVEQFDENKLYMSNAYLKRHGAVSLTDNEEEMLAALANLWQLFTRQISGSDIHNLIMGEKCDLVCNRPYSKFCVFMGAIAESRRIYSNWQQLIDRLKLVEKCGGGYITANDLVTNCCYARNVSSKHDNIRDKIAGLLGFRI